MKFNKVVTSVMKYLCFAMMAVMTIVVFAQILLRYFFHTPLAWSDELARLMFVWTSFFSIAIIYFSEKGHPAVTVLIDRWSPNVRKILFYVMNAAFAVLFFIIGVVGVRSTLANVKFESAVLHLPNSVKYAVVPLSMFLMSYKSLFNILTARSKKQADGEGEGDL